jgi:hypothetical protein
MIIKMTIPSVFFSIMAFIIVSTTSFIVIHNKSKVKHIDNKIADTNNKLFESEGKNIKKISNLVNEINLGNQKRDFKQKKDNIEQERINKKHEAKQTNLDKRFNSYKNITTANFMGMNNRITSENKRLKEDIDIVDKKLSRNATSNILRYNDLSSKLSANDLKFTNFRKNDYVSDMAKLQAQINANKNANSSLINSITRDSNDLSKLTIETGSLLNTKIDETRTALNNFLKSPNMVQTYSTKTYDDFPDNFESWHDNYYNFDQKNNFSSFNEMINSVDESITNIQSNSNNTKSNLDKITEINTYLQNNIDKDNYATYMVNTYKFNPIDLSSIKSNSDSIGAISRDISTLQTTLEQIGINDPLTNDGTISLAQLNESIQSNQESIEEIDLKTNLLLPTTSFNSYFDSRLSSNISLDFISSNIDHNTILSKFNSDENTALSVKDLSVENVMNVNDITLSGIRKSMKEIVNSNDQILDGLNVNIAHLIPDSDDTINDLYYSGFSDPMKKLMSMRSTWGFDNEAKRGLKDKSEYVLLKPGANFHLSRDTEQVGYQGSSVQYGGRIFVDSLDDIGVINRNNNSVEYDVFGRPKFAEFRDSSSNLKPLSIGDKFEDLNSKVDNYQESNESRFVQMEENSGVSKGMVFNAMHPTRKDRLHEVYSKEPWIQINGNGMRIENLYTGGYPTRRNCLNENDEWDLFTTKSECKTVHNRLVDLEYNNTSQTEAIDTQITSYMNTLNGTSDSGIGDSSQSLEIRNANLITKTLKPDKLDLTDKTDLNIIPKLKSNEITLNTLDGLKYKKTDNTVASYSSSFLNKSTDPYVSNIALDSSGYTVSIQNGTDITIPKSDSSDIKTFTKSATYTNYDEYEYGKHNNGLTEHIKVPKKYVQTINHDSTKNTLTINSIADLTNNATPTASTPIPIYPGIAQVKLDLGINANGDLPIGNNGDCLRLTGNAQGKTLKFCEDCGDADTCTTLWDHIQAPPPRS